MFGYFKALQEQWEAVTQNPIVLIPTIGLGVAVGWGLAWLILRNRLQHNREVIDDLQQRLGEDQARTGAAQAKRTRVKEQLGQYLREGHDILNRCHNEIEPAPVKEAEQWDERVRLFLSENFDSSYVARFHDWSDLPPGMNGIQSQEHSKLWSGVRVRLARLQEFIRQLD